MHTGFERALAQAQRQSERENGATEEMIEEEAPEKPRKVATNPRTPTDAEVAKHSETHIPFRSWCSICVAGKARQSGHQAREVEEGERATV